MSNHFFETILRLLDIYQPLPPLFLHYILLCTTKWLFRRLIRDTHEIEILTLLSIQCTLMTARTVWQHLDDGCNSPSSLSSCMQVKDFETSSLLGIEKNTNFMHGFKRRTKHVILATVKLFSKWYIPHSRHCFSAPQLSFCKL